MERIAPAIRAVVERAMEALRGAFGERLRSAALFGSHARGEGSARSDIDLVVVLAGRKGDEYSRLGDALDRCGLDDRPVVSVVFWSAEELARHPWLLIDVATDGIVLADDGGLEREMSDVRDRLRRLGARRVPAPEGGWYWDLKPDWRPGEIIEI